MLRVTYRSNGHTFIFQFYYLDSVLSDAIYQYVNINLLTYDDAINILADCYMAKQLDMLA